MATQKQFDKWFAKSGENAIDSYQNHYSTIKELMEDTWKAALGWIKDAGVLSYDLAGALIDEELGDERD